MSFSPQYLVAVNLLLLALVAYSASSITGTVIGAKLAPGVRVDLGPPPPPPVKEASRPASYYSLIARRDIFNSAKEEEPVANPTPAAPPPNLKLWGVALNADDAAQSYCIIEDQKVRKQMVYREGNMIEGSGTSVKKIEWDQVILERSGQEQVLELQTSKSGLKGRRRGARPAARTTTARVTDEHIRMVDDNEYVIDRSEVDKAFENLSQLFTQVRAVPHFEGGKSTGFRLFAIRRGSLFDKIGLKNGDILKQINDVHLTDPGRALSLMQEMRGESELTVQIVRNRRPQTITYRVR